MYDTTDLPTRYEFTADLTRPRQGNMLFFTRVLQLRRRRRSSVRPSMDVCIIALLRYHVEKINPLMGTLKPQSNRPFYSNTVTGR